MKYGKIQTNNLLKKLKEKNIDCLLLFNLELPHIDPNFHYFTGAEQFEGSYLILRKKPKLYVPEFEITRAERESWIRNIEKIPEKDFFKTLAKELRGSKVGINGKFTPIAIYNKLRKNHIRLTDVSKILRELRMVKNKEEIRLLRKSARAAKTILNKLSHSKPEAMLAADIYYELAKRGMKSAYDPIVAYDGDAAIPHFVPRQKTGKKSLLVDMGADYKGYHSDVTRTFLLKGADKKLKEIYKIVKEAQKLGIEAVTPGVKASAVHKVVSDFIKKNKYRLVHSTGHGIGLEIHEGPAISARSKDVLKEGMVFTIEPGIYIKGRYGVRIEDDILVTKTGCKVLSL